jgi:hypothetical protein
VVAERNWTRGPIIYFQIFYILIHYVYLSVSQSVMGVWGVGEGEAGEAAGDRCQSVTGVGPPRFPCINRLHKTL